MSAFETYFTVPRSWVQDGKLFELSSLALQVLIGAAGWAERDPVSRWDCGAEVRLDRGEWLMSRKEFQERLKMTNRASFNRAIEELSPRGPHKFHLLDWRPASEHHNAKTIWTILDPDPFIRTKPAGQGSAKSHPPDGGGYVQNRTPLAGQGSAKSHPPHTRALVPGAGAGREKGELDPVRADAREPGEPDPLSEPQFSFSFSEEQLRPEPGQSVTMAGYVKELFEDIEKERGRNGAARAEA